MTNAQCWALAKTARGLERGRTYSVGNPFLRAYRDGHRFVIETATTRLRFSTADECAASFCELAWR